MPSDRLIGELRDTVAQLQRDGTAKGDERIIEEVIAPTAEHGRRYRLHGFGDRAFIRMNANNYLGLSFHQRVIATEESAAKRFGAGPDAVRFISGTWSTHTNLEERLASFHQRPGAMLWSSAYAAVLGTLVPLIDPHTVVISDELNHNCIIDAMRLATPAQKLIYAHASADSLKQQLIAAAGRFKRALVVTDGVFSMRGGHAPLDEIAALVAEFDASFEQNALLIVDDSHGVGAIGGKGRGTEEQCGANADVLIATLGKAFGVNGGYAVGNSDLLGYLRETSPTYIYSNPITPAEAAAAATSVEIVDSDEGIALLAKLQDLTQYFRHGLQQLGFDSLEGVHPIVPVMIRDTARTHNIVDQLLQNGVLATGLAYPVVPRGDESIRFQISAEHTRADIDKVLDILALSARG